MNRILYGATVAIVASLIAPTFAQQPASPPASAPQAQSAVPTPAELDKQLAKMQEQFAKMNEEMNKIQQTRDPQVRQQLWQQHWSTMQNAMGMMPGMWGQGGRRAAVEVGT